MANSVMQPTIEEQTAALKQIVALSALFVEDSGTLKSDLTLCCDEQAVDALVEELHAKPVPCSITFAYNRKFGIVHIYMAVTDFPLLTSCAY